MPSAVTGQFETGQKSVASKLRCTSRGFARCFCTSRNNAKLTGIHSRGPVLMDWCLARVVYEHTAIQTEFTYADLEGALHDRHSR
jgi:hypothetical protein